MVVALAVLWQGEMRQRAVESSEIYAENLRLMQERADARSRLASQQRFQSSPQYNALMDKAQHSPGKNMLDSIALGDLPGIGMIIIDGFVRAGRSRNTPPAEKVPEVLLG